MTSTKANHRDGSWSSGLFDCCSDGGSCCLTFWCPCVVLGRIANITSRGSTPCVGSGALYFVIWLFFRRLASLYSFCYRTQLRRQYGLAARPCNDCCVHFFCEPCALCQEYRELQNRGFVMAIGWDGNVERQTGGVTSAPAMQGAMQR